MLDCMIWIYSTLMHLCFAVLLLVLLAHIADRLMDMLFTNEEEGNGKYAFITGCDSGFGQGAAHELNGRGVYVFAGCFTSQAVQGFKDDETFQGMAFQIDVTKKEDIENATVLIKNEVKGKGLNFLFNNAGIGQVGPIEWLSEHELRYTCEVNLWGHINVTKALLPLIKSARGRIINTTSILGRVALPYSSPYCISKFAFEAFSDALRHEMKAWGVSVHLIEPGFMRTDIYSQVSKQWQRAWDKQTEEMKEAYGEKFIEIKVKRSQVSKIDEIAADPKCVVDAYVHAALSRRPRCRYLIGVDAHIFAYTMGLLPTCVGDFVYRKLQPPVKPAGAIA